MRKLAAVAVVVAMTSGCLGTGTIKALIRRQAEQDLDCHNEIIDVSRERGGRRVQIRYIVQGCSMKGMYVIDDDNLPRLVAGPFPVDSD